MAKSHSRVSSFFLRPFQTGRRPVSVLAHCGKPHVAIVAMADRVKPLDCAGHLHHCNSWPWPHQPFSCSSGVQPRMNNIGGLSSLMPTIIWSSHNSRRMAGSLSRLPDNANPRATLTCSSELRNRSAVPRNVRAAHAPSFPPEVDGAGSCLIDIQPHAETRPPVTPYRSLKPKG